MLIHVEIPELSPEEANQSERDSEHVMQEIVSPFRDMKISRFSPVKEIDEGTTWRINPLKVEKVKEEATIPAPFGNAVYEPEESEYFSSPEGSPCESPVKGGN
jgi:hypothetical protein